MLWTPAVANPFDEKQVVMSTPIYRKSYIFGIHVTKTAAYIHVFPRPRLDIPQKNTHLCVSKRFNSGFFLTIDSILEPSFLPFYVKRLLW